MTPIPINASSKHRFQLSGTRISDHRAMVHSDIFQTSTDAAMAHFVAIASMQMTDVNGAAACGLKIRGAHEFLDTLKTLAEAPMAPPAAARDNLDPRN